MELSIQHRTLGPRKHEAAISFYSQGRQSLRAQCGFEFGVKDEDRKSIRWYLEDYLQYPVDPAPQIAAGVERRMAAIGEELFQVVFGSPEARAIWTAARPHIGKLRVAVETDVAGDTTVPWELLRERKGRPLALSARAFVRSAAGSEEVTYQPGPETDQVRILLVISRPRGQEDVPFRSVAGRILAAAHAAGDTRAHIDVLRPPTFEQLGRVLRQAAFEQAPYHIVHFDGHGTYDDVSRLDPSALFAIREAGPRGFLLFENPAAAGNVQYLDGTTLGQLLTETGVGALVLNACRSTYAEPAPAPSTTDAEEPSDIPAFGSLAQELLASGVPAVLAMRYTIYVVTAAEYMAGFYEAVSRGYTFGEAASYARKQLAADQLRQIAFDPVAFQDWSVPVVYERKPVRLLPRRSGPVRPIRIEAKQGIAPPIGFEMRLPPRPDAGFFGRDETILALDRSFDSNNIVLLHAYAGSGKTAAAAEFARWYWATGGINGPVLFTSFATRLPLTRALDHFHEAFRQELESAGKQWLAIPDQERPQHALEFLQTHEALWIWDNVEPVTGFPAGTASSWSDEEQDELRDFLQRAAGGKLRVLLTSRRDEQAWLGELPARVALTRLAFQETVQLTRELAQRRGKRITDVQDWRPLIAFTQGNPLTISMLVGQALRQRLHTRQEIDAFLAELRRGASQIQDDAELGRSRSLAASLNYGFEHAFTEEQRMQLSVLHLFEGFVGVKDVLQMAIRSALGGVARLRELTETSALALLDRAAEIGMLSHEGNGFYTMHPMLPWFLTAAFEKYCGHEREEVLQGFAVAYAINSVQLANQFDEGQHLSAANLLFREEANLLRALEYARQNQWKLAVSGLLQGLKRLYHYLGRQSEWARIVSEIVPLFCDAATERPLPDSEREWTFIMDHRVRLAYESGQWHEAERLQRICIEWDRKAAEAALLKASGDRSEEEEQAIRLLAQSYELWADILRELHREDCVAAYRDALQLYREINDSPLNAAFGLGQAYLAVDGIRDLDKARACFAGIITQPETPNHLRGRSLIQLGTIAWMRSEESETEADAQQNLDKALACFSAAEKLLPTTELRELAALKNQTSIVLVRLDRPAEAVAHCEQAIRLFERMGQSSNALIARANLARALLNAGRHDESFAYAKAVYNECQAAGDEQSDAFETAFSVLTDINDLQGRSAAGAE